MLVTHRDTWPVPDSIARSALTFVLALENAPMGILMLRNRAADALEPVLGAGLSDETCQRFGRHRAGVGPVGTAFAEHRRIAIRDILKDQSAETDIGQLARGLGARALEVIPLLLDDDRPIGVVVVFFRGRRRPSARTATLAEASGRLLAIAFENWHLRADAEERRQIIEQLARARIRFVARLSHELRTPLQSIMGYVELMAVASADPLTERQRHMLGRIRASQSMLIRAIDDLVDVVRIETGRLTYERTDVDVCAAVSSAADVIRPIAAARGLQLAIDTGGAPSVQARGDAAKVRQVLVNLLANAVRLTRPGGTVGVACRADRSDVVFEISDGRETMSAAVTEGPFEQFTQLDGDEARLTGSDLGVAISREFAHGMGGSLTMRTRAGIGAVATVRLPRSVRP